MVTRRRFLSVVALLLLAATAWTAWLTYQTASDLKTAEGAVERIRAAVSAGDSGAREEAAMDLVLASHAARQRTDGMWWSGLTRLPFVGDDLEGVKSLSASLDLVASEAVVPLGETMDNLDSLVEAGRVDIQKLRDLGPKLTSARDTFALASAMVTSQDSSGYAGAFRSRYEKYVLEVSDLAQDLRSGAKAIDVLPSLLGGSGTRQYLLIFENNAEIRATGGLPGSWALVRVRDGKIQMIRQGAASDFRQYDKPIGNITPAEQALFGKEMGRFFQDPNFTPDFPRAAEVFNAFWEARYPSSPIDGVVSLDVVALSYLLEGTGPIQAAGLTLSAGTVVEQLLSLVYQEQDAAKQDEVFRQVARATFDSMTSGLADPVAFIEGVTTAVNEGRFRVAPFVDGDIDALANTQILGELPEDSGTSPRVDIALNDATASKMSYYLRYSTSVQSTSCTGGRQELSITTTLSQIISPMEAAELPDYVTGGSGLGVQTGEQLVRLHVFAPKGGSISETRINGAAVATPELVEVNGRPAMTLIVLIDSFDDAVVSIQVQSGKGQIGDGTVEMTPSVVPGSGEIQFRAAC
jgi:hypothetical protein